jgi:GntR family transcriptional regulator, transcriptional repressor for pyruvate dehydrogenase complex
MADDVFDQVAGAIVRGEMAAGSELPPERVLAEQFGTSRIIARQAIHRLAELGLVRVRQGGATVVLDPDQAGDLRVLELLYKLAPKGGARAIDSRHVRERQLHQGFSLVEIAARRGTQAELSKVLAMTEAFAATSPAEATFEEFEEQFWQALASAGKNRIYAIEVTWWYRLLRQHTGIDAREAAPLAQRIGFYRELAERLATGRDATAFYLVTMQSLLSAGERVAAPGRRKPGPAAGKRAAR